MQHADHYIIRSFPPEPRDVEGFIRAVLKANGYERGNATIDYGVSSSIDEAYMTALAVMYEEKTGRRCDWNRSCLHNFSGIASGKMVAIFHSDQ